VDASGGSGGVALEGDEDDEDQNGEQGWSSHGVVCFELNLGLVEWIKTRFDTLLL
jgi:hypothetical protein